MPEKWPGVGRPMGAPLLVARLLKRAPGHQSSDGRRGKPRGKMRPAVNVQTRVGSTRPTVVRRFNALVAVIG